VKSDIMGDNALVVDAISATKTGKLVWHQAPLPQHQHAIDPYQSRSYEESFQSKRYRVTKYKQDPQYMSGRPNPATFPHLDIYELEIDGTQIEAEREQIQNLFECADNS
jgi:hypothetical protein